MALDMGCSQHRADLEIVRAAFQKKGEVLQHADEQLASDGDTLLAACSVYLSGVDSNHGKVISFPKKVEGGGGRVTVGSVLCTLCFRMACCATISMRSWRQFCNSNTNSCDRRGAANAAKVDCDVLHGTVERTERSAVSRRALLCVLLLSCGYFSCGFPSRCRCRCRCLWRGAGGWVGGGGET